MFKTLHDSILPSLPTRYPLLRVIFRQQIQPWHPSSTLCHESATAVLRLASDKFWPYSAALFKAQEEFYDVSVVKETRNETYSRLAKVAASVGVEEGKVLDLLKIPEKTGEDGSLNVGNRVTDDVKLMVKVSNPWNGSS